MISFTLSLINAMCKFISLVVILRSIFCDEGSKKEILRT